MNDVVTTGIACEWIDDRQIVAYQVRSVSVASINTWSEQAVATLEAWPKDRPYRAIHDISQPGIGLLFLTAVESDIFNIGVLPQAQQRVQAIMEAYPDWQLSLALVVSASLSGRMTKLLNQKASPDSQLQAKAFFNRSAAQKWLAK